MVRMADARPIPPALTARAAGYVGCRRCGKATPLPAAICPRCGSALNSRFPLSLQRTLAWLVVGLMAYVPANLLPMLVTTTLGRATPNTIVGGVIFLFTNLITDVAYVVANPRVRLG